MKVVTPQTGSTEEFATINLVKPASVRVRYCRYGSYFGIMPEKLANGRLAWPLKRATGSQNPFIDPPEIAEQQDATPPEVA